MSIGGWIGLLSEVLFRFCGSPYKFGGFFGCVLEAEIGEIILLRFTSGEHVIFALRDV